MSCLTRHIAVLCASAGLVLVVSTPHALAQEATSASGGALAGAAPSSSLRSSEHVLLGRTLHARGTITGAGGRAIRLERFDDAARRWSTVGRARGDADGSFVIPWRTDTLGRVALRAVAEGVQADASTLPATRVTVYRPAVATWYGPTLWGNGVACGGKLTRATLGVANRTLPCGTRVQLGYRGRSITVPVIDRGPFGSEATYDLTQETSDRLGMTSAGRATIGVLSQR